MEEIEKNKMVRTKKVSETEVVHQNMTAMALQAIIWNVSGGHMIIWNGIR